MHDKSSHRYSGGASPYHLVCITTLNLRRLELKLVRASCLNTEACRSRRIVGRTRGTPLRAREAKRSRFAIGLVPAPEPAGLNHLHASISTAKQMLPSSAPRSLGLILSGSWPPRYCSAIRRILPSVRIPGHSHWCGRRSRSPHLRLLGRANPGWPPVRQPLPHRVAAFGKRWVDPHFQKALPDPTVEFDANAQRTPVVCCLAIGPAYLRRAVVSIEWRSGST